MPSRNLLSLQKATIKKHFKFKTNLRLFQGDSRDSIEYNRDSSSHTILMINL